MLNIAKFQIDLKMIILPFVYIAIGIIAFKFLKKIIKKSTSRKNHLKASQKQRVDTLTVLIINLIKYIVVILVVLSILSVFGINIKSILAGLGLEQQSSD